MLTATIHNDYFTNAKTSKSGKSVHMYVYLVSGSKSELASFKEASGDFYKEDETTGKPLWFTSNPIGKSGNLKVTTNGNIVHSNVDMDMAASMTAKYGGNFGNILGTALLGQILGTNGTAPSAVVFEPASHSTEQAIVMESGSLDDVE